MLDVEKFANTDDSQRQPANQETRHHQCHNLCHFDFVLVEFALLFGDCGEELQSLLSLDGGHKREVERGSSTDLSTYVARNCSVNHSIEYGDKYGWCQCPNAEQDGRERRGFVHFDESKAQAHQNATYDAAVDIVANAARLLVEKVSERMTDGPVAIDWDANLKADWDQEDWKSCGVEQDDDWRLSELERRTESKSFTNRATLCSFTQRANSRSTNSSSEPKLAATARGWSLSLSSQLL
jgi:hypothetical protein